MAITKTTQTPIRIDAEHYTIESERKPGKIYNLTFNHETQKWQCDQSCPDLKYNKNFNCRHLYALRLHIREQKALKDGEQPVIAAATAVSEVAQDASLHEELQGLRDKVAQLEIIAEDSLNRHAVMLQRVEHLEFAEKVAYNRVDQLKADLQLETELRQNQTRIWLETSTKQHEQERTLIAAVNSHAEMIASQAAEIEKLRTDRKLDIQISVKAPSQRAARTTKAKAQPPTPAPEPAIKQIAKNKYEVGGNLVMANAQMVIGCSCDRNQEQKKKCPHMTQLEKHLGL